MQSLRKSLYHRINPPLVALYNCLSKVRSIEMLMDYVLVKFSPNVGIPVIESAQSGGSMEGDWDARAKLDATIAATSHADESHAAEVSAAAVDGRILRDLPIARGWRVLEIGCGIGALLRPMAARVLEVHGVDISSEMLQRAAKYTAANSNVTLHKTAGDLSMFSDGTFDFVYCSGVFIHFPKKVYVHTYIVEAARVVRSSGFFRFQVDGRDYLRWRNTAGGTVRGVVFSPEEMRDALTTNGFDVIDLSGSHTIDFWITARRRNV